MSKSFDMIVIGAGPGGYVSAIRGAQNGLNVAIVEREHMGGICLNWGCIPTKALLRSSEVFHLMHRAKEFGLKADGIDYDLDAVVKRSRAVAKQLNGGVGHLLKKNKVTALMGEATLTGKGNVSVKTEKGTEELTAKNIVLATGARARELPGLEADGDLVWTYKHALLPPRMPKKLLVIEIDRRDSSRQRFFQNIRCVKAAAKTDLHHQVIRRGFSKCDKRGAGDRFEIGELVVTDSSVASFESVDQHAVRNLGPGENDTLVEMY